MEFGFFLELLQRQNGFYPSAVGKFPSRIGLDTGFFAGASLPATVGQRTFDIFYFVESIAKDFFLVGAMWAPVGAVHFGAAIGQPSGYRGGFGLLFGWKAIFGTAGGGKADGYSESKNSGDEF